MNGEIIAFLSYWTEADFREVLHIQCLETRRKYQRQGYARCLVQYVQQLPDVSGIVAESVLWEAVDFWEMLGFKPDEKVEWIKGVSENAGSFSWP